MVDFLFALGQSLCIVGLLYGAYLSITYTPDDAPSPRQAKFDPVTTHAWSERADTLDERARRFSA